MGFAHQREEMDPYSVAHLDAVPPVKDLELSTIELFVGLPDERQ